LQARIWCNFGLPHKRTSKTIISQLKQKRINIVEVEEEEVAAKPTTGSISSQQIDLLPLLLLLLLPTEGLI
jgi:hypothetical protein